MKKLSAAKLRKEPVFFIERSLGKIDAPTALRNAGYACEIHDALKALFIGRGTSWPAQHFRQPSKLVP